eukprot:277145-Amorphochlora_amoeboformis.AAC.1
MLTFPFLLSPLLRYLSKPLPLSYPPLSRYSIFLSSLTLKVVGVSVCADPEAALVNLFGGEFGVGNEGVDNDDRDIELTLEDDTAQ